MNLKKTFAVAIVACAIAAQPAISQPANSFISFGGLDWAWASPCAAVGGCAANPLNVNPGGLWRPVRLWRATPGGPRCTAFPGRGTPSG